MNLSKRSEDSEERSSKENMSEQRGIILYNDLVISRTNLIQFYESNMFHLNRFQ